jgi:hypothetical protein
VSRSHICAWYSISHAHFGFSTERRSAPFVVFVSHCMGVFLSLITVHVARAVFVGSDFRSRHQFTMIPLLSFSVHILIQHRRSNFLLHSRFLVSGSRSRTSVLGQPLGRSALLAVWPRSRRPDFGFCRQPRSFVHFVLHPRFGLCCQQQLDMAAFQEFLLREFWSSSLVLLVVVHQFCCTQLCEDGCRGKLVLFLSHWIKDSSFPGPRRAPTVFSSSRTQCV